MILFSRITKKSISKYNNINDYLVEYLHKKENKKILDYYFQYNCNLSETQLQINSNMLVKVTENYTIPLDPNIAYLKIEHLISFFHLNEDFTNFEFYQTSIKLNLFYYLLLQCYDLIKENYPLDLLLFTVLIKSEENSDASLLFNLLLNNKDYDIINNIVEKILFIKEKPSILISFLALNERKNISHIVKPEKIQNKKRL